MNRIGAVRSRVDLSALSLALAVGDALAIGTFVLVGTINHGTQPLREPGAVAEALAPFLLAWFLAALVAGLYTPRAVATPRGAVRSALPAWVGAVLLGHALRATPLFEGGTTLAFLLVTLLVGGALVVGWRVLAAALSTRL